MAFFSVCSPERRRDDRVLCVLRRAAVTIVTVLVARTGMTLPAGGGEVARAVYTADAAADGGRLVPGDSMRDSAAEQTV